jgi:hypothetical protein
VAFLFSGSKRRRAVAFFTPQMNYIYSIKQELHAHGK